MYLRECLVENIGPIRSLDVSFSMNEEGNPKPVVLVGPNGTGKTIFLSFIADALIEFAKTAYRDVVVPQPTMQSPYFRVLSPLNVTWNCKFGIALLEFLDKDKKFSYIEKTGKLDVETFNAKLKKRFQLKRKIPNLPLNKK